MGTAAIYCRISEDPEGEALGVARQEADCRALAEKQGLTVVEVYPENDTGASTASRKKSRPEYDRMLADARAGKFDVILAYSNSRLTRRPLEMEALIELYNTYKVRISTVVSGEDDMATADGRLMARLKANIDAAEAERTAERVARKHLENAMAGKPVGGTRPFGWDDDKVTIRPTEAAAIRRAAEDVLAGVSMRKIAAEWNDQGFVTTLKGKPWTGAAVRQVLLSPRLAGLRVHRPKGTRWSPVPTVALGKDGRPVRGQWEPIIDTAMHRALVAKLVTTDTRSRIPRRGARHYLATGLLRCGVCNGPMYGNKRGDTHYYSCNNNGHMNTASGRGVDEWIGELVQGKLATEDFDQPAPAFDGQARLGEIKQKISELMAAYNTNKMSAAVVFPAVEALEAERGELIRARDEAEAAALRPTLTHLDREQWEAMDTDRQRGIAETLLQAVMVRPATGPRSNKFDHTRLDPVWR